MSISYRVLGKPGWDNGLLVAVNSGTRFYRLLFDCGENILMDLSLHDIKSIDYLFLSHLHIDHIAGFDFFFRRNYDREKKPVYVYGPEETIKIIQNRLRGFKWNLVKGVPGLWYVTETDDKVSRTVLFKTEDGFSVKYPSGKRNHDSLLIDNAEFSVNVSILDHIIPSAAYFVKEKASVNINKEVLISTGLTPGPWLEKVRDINADPNETIIIDNNKHKLESLRKKLLEKRKGDSIGYLTDFVYNRGTIAKVKKVFRRCGVMICESQYLSSEKAYAIKNYHLTAMQSARLAKAAKAEKLILFHISDRYRAKEYPELIGEAREIFPGTYFPEEWNIKY